MHLKLSLSKTMQKNYTLKQFAVSPKTHFIFAYQRFKTPEKKNVFA